MHTLQKDFLRALRAFFENTALSLGTFLWSTALLSRGVFGNRALVSQVTLRNTACSSRGLFGNRALVLTLVCKILPYSREVFLGILPAHREVFSGILPAHREVFSGILPWLLNVLLLVWTVYCRSNPNRNQDYRESFLPDRLKNTALPLGAGFENTALASKVRL